MGFTKPTQSYIFKERQPITRNIIVFAGLIIYISPDELMCVQEIKQYNKYNIYDANGMLKYISINITKNFLICFISL